MIDYKSERVMYYKVLVGLLLLTAVTFVLPYLFEAGANLPAQMFIAVIKAWLILMFYMHLKGEKLISVMGIFSLAIVLVFFIIVLVVDVANFQFKDESHITAPQHTTTGVTENVAAPVKH
jgi:caa(3)-type oxidase subunit IV